MKRLFLLFFVFVLVVFSPIKAEELTFAVVGDSHVGQGNSRSIFRNILGQIALIKPNLVFHTGDLVCGRWRTKNQLTAEYKEFLQMTRKYLDQPVYTVLGNHDVFEKYGEELYIKYINPKLYYSFNYRHAHFICLDTEIDGQEGKITGRQYLWLKNDLQQQGKDKVIFVFMHRPLFPFIGRDYVTKKLFYDHDPENHQIITNLFTSFKVNSVFCGHEHIYREKFNRGIFYYTTGGGGAPLHVMRIFGGFHHFLLVQVKGSETKVTPIRSDDLTAKIYYAKTKNKATAVLINKTSTKLPIQNLKFIMPADKFKITAYSQSLENKKITKKITANIIKKKNLIYITVNLPSQSKVIINLTKE